MIDVQIVGEQSDLERARTAKIRKYADNPDIERAIQRETGSTNIRHLPVILSWRGVWCTLVYTVMIAPNQKFISVL